jgi:hypothetical protein
MMEHLFKKGNPTTLTNVLELLPNGWSQQRCETCGMVFALPPLDESTGIKAKDFLTEELDMHTQRTHVDVPSARDATSNNSV